MSIFVTMEKNIDYFSVNDLFWIQVKEHLISFGYKELPKDIHFTISFNSVRGINLHVTKNTNDFKNKPQIGIVTISKDDFDRFENLITKKLLRLILKPFDIGDFKKRNMNKVGFLSFEKIYLGNTGKMIEEKLKGIIKPISKLQKRSRFKIKGDIETAFNENPFSTTFLKKMMKHIRPLNFKSTLFVEGGNLISRKESITVVKIDDKWFEFNQPDITNLLILLMGENIGNKIKWRLKRAIVLVKNANTYKEVEKYNSAPVLHFGNKPR